MIDLKKLLTELLKNSKKNPVLLAENTDLNSITDIGEYICPSTELAVTLLNRPINHAKDQQITTPFRMVVEIGANVFETPEDAELYRTQTLYTQNAVIYARWLKSTDGGTTWTVSPYSWIRQAYSGGARLLRTSSGSVTVAAAGFYNLCSVTFPAYSGTWLLLTHTWSNNGSNFEMLNEMILSSGTPARFTSHPTRVTTGSGQGVSNWGFLVMGSTDVTITLRSYGYYTTSHTEAGHIMAIKL